MGEKTPRHGALPWAELMALGMGLLQLPPPVFWGLTFKEFNALLGGRPGTSPTSRMQPSILRDLMQKFPDRGPVTEKPKQQSKQQ